jgi:hypothetical protein
LGENWDTTIRDNIIQRNHFIIIVRRGALVSPQVRDEVLQATDENKRVIPCLHSAVTFEKMEWNINNRQGLQFENRHELMRELYINLPKFDDMDMTMRKNSVITSVNKWRKKPQFKALRKLHL